MNEASVLRAGIGDTPDLSVIILTLNEEKNLPFALRSVSGWARAVFILDSGSSDATVDIARSHGCQIASRPFDNYSSQRNYALQNLPIETEWVLFLDADEWIPVELKDEISRILESRPPHNGYYLSFRLVWMGRELRHSVYAAWILRLFRRGAARCDDRGVNERLDVEGGVGYCRHRLVHEDRKGLHSWIAKHNLYSTMEAELLFGEDPARPGRLFGSPSDRKRWLRTRVWNHLPPVFRVFLYYIYRYVFCLGFLDGFPGLTYHFLQGFWYPLLIDLKYLEAKRTGPNPDPSAATPDARPADAPAGNPGRE